MRLNEDHLTLINSDCLEGLQQIPDETVDLIFTSPPYADRRKDKYSSVSEKKYVEWFLPIACELKRVLKPSGSFFLNLKAHCDKGERTLYVMDLVLNLKRVTGFKFIDEYVWYKSASPRRRSSRLKDAWEPIYHFSKEKNSFIDHSAIEIRSKSTFANKRGFSCFNDLTGNTGGYHEIADQAKGFTTPDNILYFPTALLVKDKFPHPAKFPLELVEFFVKGFCPAGGVVCDPFVGSGTTALAALIHDKYCYAIELEQKYCNMTRERIKLWTPPNPTPSYIIPDLFPSS